MHVQNIDITGEQARNRSLVMSVKIDQQGENALCGTAKNYHACRNLERFATIDIRV